MQRGHASGAIARRVPIVSDAQRQQIIALNATGGISCIEIARRFNVDKHAVYRVLRRAGVKSSAVARSQQFKPRILELWQAGWKADAIAHACGTTLKNVWATAYRAAKKNPALRRQAPPLTPAEIERVVALRREGHYSGAEIAQLMDLNHGAVTRAIRKLAQSDPDLALDARLVSKSRMSEVLLLMAQGLPLALIAERFDVDRASMAQLLYRLRHRAKTRGGLVSPGVKLELLPDG
jgi:DNA-binding MarR family transcriptional regulator